MWYKRKNELCSWRGSGGGGLNSRPLFSRQLDLQWNQTSFWTAGIVLGQGFPADRTGSTALFVGLHPLFIGAIKAFDYALVAEKVTWFAPTNQLH